MSEHRLPGVAIASDQRQVRTVGGLTRAGRAKAWGEAVELATFAARAAATPEGIELARLVLLLAPGDAGAGGSTVPE